MCAYYLPVHRHSTVTTTEPAIQQRLVRSRGSRRDLTREIRLNCTMKWVCFEEDDKRPESTRCSRHSIVNAYICIIVYIVYTFPEYRALIFIQTRGESAR